MSRRRRWTLIVVSAATALLLLDVTVVNVALPAIQEDLGSSFDELQWVIDAYALTLAATLLTAGALADRYGRRLVFLALFALAPLSGRLTSVVSLRSLLAAGLGLIGAGLLLMRGLHADSTWTALLPGMLVGGAGIGVISPALASAMVGVLSEERHGLASGINNTFRQAGIAFGIAVLGAIFEGHVRAAALGGGSAAAGTPAAVRGGFVAGLNQIFLVAALVALVAVPVALVLVRPSDLHVE